MRDEMGKGWERTTSLIGLPFSAGLAKAQRVVIGSSPLATCSFLRVKCASMLADLTVTDLAVCQSAWLAGWLTDSNMEQANK